MLNYSPSSYTTDLIALTLPSTTNQIFKTFSVTLGAFNNIKDAETYTVTIRARYVGATDWLTYTTATVTYVDPCSVSTITANPHPKITTSQKVASSSLVDIWYDSFSGSPTSVRECGDFSISVAISSTSLSYDDSTMSDEFTWTDSGPQSQLSVDP